MEFIQRPFQPALDAYISGAITEREFLKRAEYFDRWGFDYRLYRPIFSFAKEHGIPMVALNAERELAEKVAKVGKAYLRILFVQRYESWKTVLPDSDGFGLYPSHLLLIALLTWTGQILGLQLPAAWRRI